MDYTNLKRELRKYIDEAIRNNLSLSEFRAGAQKISNSYLGDENYKSEIVNLIYKEYKFTSSGAVLKKDGTVVNDVLKDLSTDFAKTRAGLRDDVVDIIKKGIEAGDFTKELSTRLNSVDLKYKHYNDTIARTALSGYDTLSQYKDEPDTTRYTYAGGPAQSNFCKNMLILASSGKTWTRKELEAMDNGTGYNVFLYGGHPNCVHQRIKVK